MLRATGVTIAPWINDLLVCRSLRIAAVTQRIGMARSGDLGWTVARHVAHVNAGGRSARRYLSLLSPELALCEIDDCTATAEGGGNTPRFGDPRSGDYQHPSASRRNHLGTQPSIIAMDNRRDEDKATTWRPPRSKLISVHREHKGQGADGSRRLQRSESSVKPG